MNQKGFTLLEIFLVVFIGSLLGFGTAKALEKCRIFCYVNKLDVPKYQAMAMEPIDMVIVKK